jgi:hypothetical protein
LSVVLTNLTLAYASVEIPTNAANSDDTTTFFENIISPIYFVIQNNMDFPYYQDYQK